MTLTSVSGFPRVGANRELKFWTEDFFSGKLTEEALQANASQLRQNQWRLQKSFDVDYIPSNDFSFYDTMLDTSVMFNIIPTRYRELKLNDLATYFVMARGYQGKNGDVKALAMKKWFNTNYHYIVPEIEHPEDIRLVGHKPLNQYLEAKNIGIETRPVIIGPFTFLSLCSLKNGINKEDCASKLILAYQDLLGELARAGVSALQMDEPILVTDLDKDEQELFFSIYNRLLTCKANMEVTLQTYFGDVRDVYEKLIKLDVNGLALDFVEGRQTLDIVRKHGFPADKKLFAGVVNGKNIWRNDYKKTLVLLSELSEKAEQLVISTSCSLLHVPYTLKSEPLINEDAKSLMAFAEEKLQELSELKSIVNSANPLENPLYKNNCHLFDKDLHPQKENVRKRVTALTENDFVRLPERETRAQLQAQALNLPLLPTTTIGSFPQTADVKQNRALFRKKIKSESEYIAFNKQKIARCIEKQEELGLDVLVHGEYERNDMAEYFGENLHGFIFTSKGWVQSYGTRCVKPPVVFGDIERTKPITVDYAVFAQSCTTKPVKGMLTGPVTILNWSFPREDVSLKESAMQLALAIRDEVLDLEAHGIRIIQIDEAALKEKLPLRKADWHTEYLSWAINAFRLVHSGVKPETQIHTHMCYSEFIPIIKDIDNMDADVISFEASRSSLHILDALKSFNFRTAVGPGVYDIHSPRIPSEEEIVKALKLILSKLSVSKVWVNPDCGLKTRGEEETIPSLKNLVEAAKKVREDYK